MSTDTAFRTAGVTDLIQVGLTYRQIDYAATKGWLRSLDDGNPGSGHARRFPWSEIRVAKVMVQLTDLGVGAAKAAELARAGAVGAAELRRLADLVEGVAA
jgi:hypothetical protein